MDTKIQAYMVLQTDGTPPFKGRASGFSQRASWKTPITMDIVYHIRPPLVSGMRGLHWWRHAIDAVCEHPGTRICGIEVWGETLATQSDQWSTIRGKMVDVSGDSEYGRVLWMADIPGILMALARRVALDVGHVWAMPETVRQYFATGDEALREMAWEATWEVARDEVGISARWKASAVVDARNFYRDRWEEPLAAGEAWRARAWEVVARAACLAAQGGAREEGWAVARAAAGDREGVADMAAMTTIPEEAGRAALRYAIAAAMAATMTEEQRAAGHVVRAVVGNVLEAAEYVAARSVPAGWAMATAGPVVVAEAMMRDKTRARARYEARAAALQRYDMWLTTALASLSFVNNVLLPRFW